MQAAVDTSNYIHTVAMHDTVTQRLGELIASDETTCSGERSLQVTFVAGRQEPIVGRLEVVDKMTGNKYFLIYGSVCKFKLLQQKRVITCNQQTIHFTRVGDKCWKTIS